MSDQLIRKADAKAVVVVVEVDIYNRIRKLNVVEGFSQREVARMPSDSAPRKREATIMTDEIVAIVRGQCSSRKERTQNAIGFVCVYVTVACRLWCIMYPYIKPRLGAFCRPGRCSLTQDLRQVEVELEHTREQLAEREAVVVALTQELEQKAGLRRKLQLANWVLVGRTTGRGKWERKEENKIRAPLSVKRIFVYPLCSDFRCTLVES